MAVISRPNGAAVVVVMSERYRYARGSACALLGGGVHWGMHWGMHRGLHRR